MKKRGNGIYLVFGLMFVLLILFGVQGYHDCQGKSVWWMIAFTGVLLVMLAAALAGTLLFYKDLKTRIHTDAVQVSLKQKHYLDHWNYPYAVVDRAGSLIWYNREFANTFAEANLSSKTLFQLIGDLDVEMPDNELESVSTSFMLNDQYYEMIIKMIRKDEEMTDSQQLFVYAVSMENKTQQMELEHRTEDMKMAVCLLYIDNFDTILNRLDEGQRPMLEAMIYRNFNEMISAVHGLMTELERDKFLMIFSNRALQSIEKNRFEILNKIKKVSLGDSNSEDLPLTISIGVGVADQIDQAQAYARSAVDLAMGRGGDQAVVKKGEKYTFYGGGSAGLEKSSRTRVQLVAYALRQLILEHEQVLIMGHKNPDLDCFGAALGMYRIVADLGKTAHIVIGERHTAIDFLLERVDSERDYQNVVIGLDEARQRSGINTLLIIVDVNRASMIEYAELLDYNQSVAVIDHHRTSADHIENASVSYVETYSSSACEMVTEIIQYITEQIRVHSIEADGLFSGIQLDTRNFTRRCGVRTFEAAAYLRRNGADSVRVAKLFRNDFYEYQVKAHIVSQAVMTEDQMAISVWDDDTSRIGTAAAQAADELLSITGVRASFVLAGTSEHISISARSSGDINVQRIMEKIGGGGHMMMAGGQIEGHTMDEAVGILQQAISDYLNERAMEFRQRA